MKQRGKQQLFSRTLWYGSENWQGQRKLPSRGRSL